MIRRPPRSTLSSSSAASDVYKRQPVGRRVLRRLHLPGTRGEAAARAPHRMERGRSEEDGAGDWTVALGDGELSDRLSQRGEHQGDQELLPVQESRGDQYVEQSVSSDHAGGLTSRKTRGSFGKTVAPYLLSLPAGVWLVLLFIIPLGSMLIMSLEPCSPASGVCVMTWHWGEMPSVVNLYRNQFFTSLYFCLLYTSPS